MLGIAAGMFVLLHGLVHLLYFGQSRRLFELRPGMAWPLRSWAFSKVLGDQATRAVASIVCILAAAGLAVSGVAILAGIAWSRPVAMGAAAFSAIGYVLLWDGRAQGLADQGGAGLLIDLAILPTALAVR